MGDFVWQEDEMTISDSDESFQTNEKAISSDNICFEEYQGASEIIAEGKNLYSEVWEQDDQLTAPPSMIETQPVTLMLMCWP